LQKFKPPVVNKLAAFTLSMLMALLIVFLTTINTFYSPLFFSKKLSEENMLPQGWGFFSKNPRDVVVSVYDYNTKANLLIPRSSYKYFFGLSRKQGKLAMEIGALAGEIADSLWVKDFEANYELGEFVHKKSIFKNKLLCDTIVLANKERKPWAWHSYQNLKYPEFFVKIINESE